MASPSSWEFYKEDQNKILWAHICAQDLTGVGIQLIVEDKISKIQNASGF